MRHCTLVKVVYESSLATPDEEATQDALLQRAAEKDPDYFGSALSQVWEQAYSHSKAPLSSLSSTGAGGARDERTSDDVDSSLMSLYCHSCNCCIICNGQFQLVVRSCS